MPRTSFPTSLYRGLTTTLPLASRLWRGQLAAQRAASARWAAWAETDRPDGPLLWIHGASVGELLTAAPVARRILRRGAAAIVSSHTSRSVAERRPPVPTLQQDYLPLDTAEDTARALDAVRPDVIMIARSDMWPGFLTAARHRSIPVAVVGGEIGPQSLKLQFPARSLYAPLVRGVSWIGAVSPEDADRWCRLGAEPGIVEVTGDPRHDEVLDHLTDLHAIAPYREWASAGPVLVAGSVEPSDIGPLLGAWEGVRRDAPTARLLVVPHDPTPPFLGHLARIAVAPGEVAVIGSSRIAAQPAAARCVIHDRIGNLADLYALADIAYVGGGFRRRKLHAVIEPAAMAVPVIAGPQATDHADARALLTHGGLVSVRDIDELRQAWQHWLTDASARLRAGIGARSALAAGAAERSTDAVVALL